MSVLCGPKFLRGIRTPCDGSCCGVGKDGKPDIELTAMALSNAWLREREARETKRGS